MLLCQLVAPMGSTFRYSNVFLSMLVVELKGQFARGTHHTTYNYTSTRSSEECVYDFYSVNMPLRILKTLPKCLSNLLIELLAYLSQMTMGFSGGFQVIKSERKVRFV